MAIPFHPASKPISLWRDGVARCRPARACYARVMVANPSSEIEAAALDVQIGARLRHARRTRGLTQTQLGDALGVSFQQVQKYERGTNRISSSTLIIFARLLNASPADLLGQNIPDSVDWSLITGDAYELLKAFAELNSPEDRETVLMLSTALAAR